MKTEHTKSLNKQNLYPYFYPKKESAMERKETESSLQKIYTFKDFVQAMKRMQQVGEKCQEQNHHPIRTNTYNTVNVKLSTHDAENTVTEKDRNLAEVMDQIYTQYHK
jgi:4a-hydroxytetrahydrobiopterin dehydratase